MANLNVEITAARGLRPRQARLPAQQKAAQPASIAETHPEPFPDLHAGASNDFVSRPPCRSQLPRKSPATKRGSAHSGNLVEHYLVAALWRRR
jgi:hypothetical protein